MAKGNTRFLTMGPSPSDIASLVLLLLIALYVELYPAPFERPIDLADPSIHMPHKKDIVPSHLLVLFSLLGPLLIFCVVEIRGLSTKRTLFLLFFTYLFEANLLTVVITNVLKLLIGRPRPYFASVCVGYVPGTDNQCTGDAHSVKEARKSFPSGHSSLAFSAGVFLACYLAIKFGIGKSSNTTSTWKICAVLTPPLIAAVVAASRVIDYHHHYADILAGSILGASIALFVFYGRRPAMTKLSESKEDDDLSFHVRGYDAVPEEEV